MRSLNSSVLKWPDRSAVDQAARAWAQVEAERHPELQRLGYFGSYARGDWSVGSDLDLVAIVDRSFEPLERRALGWDLLDLPIPAELLIYTADEWKSLKRKGGRFVRVLEREVVWIYGRAD
ncbi:MAG TPA: nucleotidyltransferase domain-containing protein [Syntrophobacteria bacterium]|nr:nucleotidyltransferase domain-containing protein [Syntrophobacteria bacterium]